MDKTKITLIILLIILLGGFLVYSFVNTTSEQKMEVERSNEAASTTDEDRDTLLEAQINEEGPVSVSIQPLMSSFGVKDLWEFDVTLSTHSVDLTTDVMESILLVDDLGEEYRPTKWEGDPPSGHHREVKVFFSPLESISTSFVMLVRDIGDVSERKFVWTTTP